MGNYKKKAEKTSLLPLSMLPPYPLGLHMIYMVQTQTGLHFHLISQPSPIICFNLKLTMEAIRRLDTFILVL